MVATCISVIFYDIHSDITPFIFICNRQPYRTASPGMHVNFTNYYLHAYLHTFMIHQANISAMLANIQPHAKWLKCT